jgi:hypothetical protein
MERNPNHNDQRDRQLDRLAGQMRDTGVAPDRDLWPDINAAIDRVEQKARPRKSRPLPGNWMRMTAVAAALTLMLTAGWVGVQTIGKGTVPGMKGQLQAVADSGPLGGLSVIDRALDELTLALADDPENKNLTHLVLMVHKTRGSLLRKNSENIGHDQIP